MPQVNSPVCKRVMEAEARVELTDFACSGAVLLTCILLSFQRRCQAERDSPATFLASSLHIFLGTIREEREREENTVEDVSLDSTLGLCPCC